MKRNVSSIFDGQAIFKAPISIVFYHPFNYYIFTPYYYKDGTYSSLTWIRASLTRIRADIYWDTDPPLH